MAIKKKRLAALVGLSAALLAGGPVQAATYILRMPVHGLKLAAAPAPSYATWGTPLKGSVSGDVASLASTTYGIPANKGASSGKWYWELTINAVGSGAPVVGIVPSGMTSANYIGAAGQVSSGVGWYLSSGNACTWTSCGFSASYTAKANDVLGLAIDVDNKTIKWYANGTLVGTTSGVSTPKPWFPAVSNASGGGANVITANFGASPLKYSPPTGYVAGFAP